MLKYFFILCFFAFRCESAAIDWSDFFTDKSFNVVTLNGVLSSVADKKSDDLKNLSMSLAKNDAISAAIVKFSVDDNFSSPDNILRIMEDFPDKQKMSAILELKQRVEQLNAVNTATGVATAEKEFFFSLLSQNVVTGAEALDVVLTDRDSGVYFGLTGTSGLLASDANRYAFSSGVAFYPQLAYAKNTFVLELGGKVLKEGDNSKIVLEANPYSQKSQPLSPEYHFYMVPSEPSTLVASVKNIYNAVIKSKSGKELKLYVSAESEGSDNGISMALVSAGQGTKFNLLVRKNLSSSNSKVFSPEAAYAASVDDQDFIAKLQLVMSDVDNGADFVLSIAEACAKRAQLATTAVFKSFVQDSLRGFVKQKNGLGDKWSYLFNLTNDVSDAAFNLFYVLDSYGQPQFLTGVEEGLSFSRTEVDKTILFSVQKTSGNQAFPFVLKDYQGKLIGAPSADGKFSGDPLNFQIVRGNDGQIVLSAAGQPSLGVNGNALSKASDLSVQIFMKPISASTFEYLCYSSLLDPNKPLALVQDAIISLISSSSSAQLLKKRLDFFSAFLQQYPLDQRVDAIKNLREKLKANLVAQSVQSFQSLVSSLSQAVSIDEVVGKWSMLMIPSASGVLKQVLDTRVCDKPFLALDKSSAVDVNSASYQFMVVRVSDANVVLISQGADSKTGLLVARGSVKDGSVSKPALVVDSAKKIDVKNVSASLSSVSNLGDYFFSATGNSNALTLKIGQETLGTLAIGNYTCLSEKGSSSAASFSIIDARSLPLAKSLTSNFEYANKFNKLFRGRISYLASVGKLDGDEFSTDLATLLDAGFVKQGSSAKSSWLDISAIANPNVALKYREDKQLVFNLAFRTKFLAILNEADFMLQDDDDNYVVSMDATKLYSLLKKLATKFAKIADSLAGAASPAAVPTTPASSNGNALEFGASFDSIPASPSGAPSGQVIQVSQPKQFLQNASLL